MSRSRAIARLFATLLGCGALAASVPVPGSAEVVEPPPSPTVSLGAVQVAATYPRAAVGRLHVPVHAREGHPVLLTFAAAGVSVRLIGCRAVDGLGCTIDQAGLVSATGDGDEVLDEPMELDVEASVVPQRGIALTSVEGIGFTPAARSLAVGAGEADAPADGLAAHADAILHIVTNPALDAEIEFETTLPAEGVVVEPGAVVPFRATMRRTGSKAIESVVTLDVVPEVGDPLDAAGLIASVRMAPGVATTTVQMSLVVPSGPASGPRRWRLRARYGVDVGLGALRTVVVQAPKPPAPPAPTPEPAPAPAPTPVPVDRGGGPAGTDVPPARATGSDVAMTPDARPVAVPDGQPAGDHSPPAVAIHLFSSTRIHASDTRRIAVPLGITCPRSERACRVVVDVAWRSPGTKRRVVVARAVVLLRGGATTRATMHLTPVGRTLLARHRLLRAVLSVDANDAAGNHSRGHQAIQLRLDRAPVRAPG
ncbi:MAG: hypothetical protein JWM98_3311 [Thermoleophilia bacterium]|nr:hypothetical protein [Thermoleophilia bacterium]